MGILCNQCYKELTEKELSVYPLQWRYSGDMYCYQHETREQFKIQKLSELTPQLIGLEGYRVEVITDYDEKRRFIVGRSTGWRPIHLEISRRTALGGPAAEKHYKSVTVLYKTR